MSAIDHTDIPPGWEREIPKYRVTREIHPAEKARFRFERPFTEQSDPDRWQYGARILKRNEEISTTEWPHPSFFPLNYSAKKVHDFFMTRQRSRLARSPWANDQIRLDDGLSGPPKFNPPVLTPMNLRPAS